MSEPNTSPGTPGQIDPSQSIYEQIKRNLIIQVEHLQQPIQQDQDTPTQTAVAHFRGNPFLSLDTCITLISFALPLICGLLSEYYPLPLLQPLSQIFGDAARPVSVTLFFTIAFFIAYLIVDKKRVVTIRPSAECSWCQHAAYYTAALLPLLFGGILAFGYVSGVRWVLKILVFMLETPMNCWWYPFTLLILYLASFSAMLRVCGGGSGNVKGWVSERTARMGQEGLEKVCEVVESKESLSTGEGWSDCCHSDEGHGDSDEDKLVDVGVGGMKKQEKAPEGSLAAEFERLGEVVDELEG